MSDKPKGRVLRMEVVFMETVQTTKEFDVPEAVGNQMIGGLYNDGWSDEKTIEYAKAAVGDVIETKVMRELDTVDCLRATPDWDEENKEIHNSTQTI